MTTIKSYTDISQCRKLAEILPLESADMRWIKIDDDESFDGSWEVVPMDSSLIAIDDKPLFCWSLSALLDVMPKDKSIECSLSFGYYSGKGEYIEKWLCAFEKEGETTDDYIIKTFDGDNPVDACVAMIEKLHELNLL